MPYLAIFVSEETAKRVRSEANLLGVSVSRFLTELVSSVDRPAVRDAGDSWPSGFWDEVVGGWNGERIPRPAQGAAEQRDPL